MKRFCFLLLACAMAGCATPDARPSLLSVDTLKSVTAALSGDSFEGRGPGTPAEEKTLAYIVDQFARAGLQPGNAGDWFQSVPLVEITTDSDTVLDISGGATPLRLAFKTDMIATTYRVEPKVAVAGADMVFVGYGINAPERGWNDYAGVDVRGKTVIILVNDSDYRHHGLDGPFGGRAMTYYGRWTYKLEEAARQGAAAAFIVHDTEPASYPWDVVISSWTGPQFALDGAGAGKDQSQVIGWLSQDGARRMMATAGQDLDRLTAAAQVQGFKAVPLGLKASIRLNNRIMRRVSRNVLGILPGSEMPRDHVLYSAHWDHLGRCEPDASGDDICNGAVDNASGIAGLVALAKAQVKMGPARRSILFLAVTAEESGLLGSEFYGAHPVYPLARTVGGINIDGLNIAGRTHDVTVIGGGKSELEGMLAPLVKAQGRVLRPEATPEKGYFYRSDHFSFAKRGVPMIYFESGLDLVDGGIAAGQAKADDYTQHRYHKPADEYDPAWNWRGAVDDLEIALRLGRALADSDAWPNWYHDAEFRRTRDESRAGR